MAGGIIVNKKIVVTAEDRATSVIAKTNQLFEQLDQKLSSLGMKINTFSSEQSGMRSGLSATNATVGESSNAFKRLDDAISKIKNDKHINVTADTDSAKDNVSSLDSAIDSLPDKTIDIDADDSGADEAISNVAGDIDELPDADVQIDADTDDAEEGIDTVSDKIKKVPEKKETAFHADTTQAQRSLGNFQKNIDALRKDAPVIKPKVDPSGAQDSLSKLNRALNATKRIGGSLKDFVAGNLIANGLQNAAASAKNFAIQGFQAAEAGEQTTARWKSLGMTAGGIKQVGAAVTDLKENTNLSGVAAGNLVTRFYGLTGSTERAIALAKGVGSISDSLRLSGDASDAFANGLARIEASGKVTSQSLGRLERQAPGITSALQKASGMSKKSFDDLLSSGKMTADQFNDILERASKNYQENAKSWTSTSQGALKNIRETWAASWKAMMAPLAESSGQGLGALSKALQTLQPQFKELGEAVANLATRFAQWLTPKHAKDMGEIIGSLGRMAVVLGKGVWKAAVAPFELLGRAIQMFTGKHGDALDALATGLDRISKNKIAMTVLEGIGAVLATQFAYGKLFNIASALFKIDGALGKISGIKFSGHMFSDLFTNLGRLSKVHGITAGKQWLSGFAERAKGVSFKNFFVGAPKDASIAGDLTGSTFVSRFAQKTQASKFTELGRGMAGKLGAGITIGLSAVDVARGLTPSFRGDRWKEVGKGAGGLIGAGIGGYFFGPGGAAVGATVGNIVGGWLGKAAHKGFNFMRDVFHGRITFSGIEHGFAQTMSKVGKWAQDTWKRIKSWWNQDPTEEGRKKADRNNKEPSQHEIKSLGGNHYSKTDIANIKQMNAAVKAYTNTLKTLKSVVKKNDPTKELRSMSKSLKSLNPTIKNAAKYWKNLDKPLANSSRSFKLLDKSLSGFKGKNNPLDRLESSVKSLTKTVQRYKFGKELAKQMNEADKSMSGKHSFVGRFQTMTRQVESSLRSFDRAFNRDWKDTWDNIDRYPSRSLSRVSSTVNSRLNSIRSHENSFTHGFLSSWKSWTASVVSSMSSEFGKLPGIAQRAMSGIVSRLNSGISAINGVIGDFGGDKKLSTIHYARGTFAHPGGKAVVNDGPEANKTELIWQPSKGWGTAQGQNVVRDLEAGSMVLDAKRSAPYLVQGMFPHYAEGTLSEAEQDKISQEFINNPIQASKNLVLKLTNWNSNVPVITDLGKATAIGFSRGIANVLKDLLGIIKEPINGDWTPVIKSAARLMHVSLSAGQIGKLLRQIQTESGGNEKITQQISDVNSAAGHPAQGLLQFIPSTFNTWAMPGHHNILSGFDQIMAAINALNHGGEGGWGNIGNGHGWAAGVHMTHSDLAWIGDNPEHDEYVINPYNSNSLPLMNEAWSKMALNHPEWQSNDGNEFNGQVIKLIKTAVDKLDNIDIHPYVSVTDMQPPLDKANAQIMARRKGW